MTFTLDIAVRVTEFPSGTDVLLDTSEMVTLPHVTVTLLEYACAPVELPINASYVCAVPLNSVTFAVQVIPV